MTNTLTTDPVQTDFEGEEMRERIAAKAQSLCSERCAWSLVKGGHCSDCRAYDESDWLQDAAVAIIAQLQADIIAVRKERDEARAYAKEVGTALVSLTCDGSEFYRRAGEDFRVDPAACVEYVRHQGKARFSTIKRFAERAHAAEAEASSLRLERDAFEQEVKGLRERLEELQGAPATPSGSQASPEAPSDLRPEGFDPSRTPAPHMEGLWPRRPNPTRHPDGSAMFYDIPWIKDWRTVTGRTLKEGMEAHRRALHGLMAYGCCSAVSPCSHQRRDPYSLCLTCQGIADRAEASATEARRVETLGSTCEGAAPTGETPNPNPLTQEEADA